MKRYPLLCLTVAALLLSACNRPANDTAATPSAARTAPAVAPVAKPRARRITAEDIAQIEATGRTGLWSQITEVCRQPVKPGIATLLTWNVKASGADTVVLYVVARNGQERNFGRGGPVGRKATGPWLRPGTVFKLRRQDNKQEVGAVTIGEKAC